MIFLYFSFLKRTKKLIDFPSSMMYSTWCAKKNYKITYTWELI